LEIKILKARYSTGFSCVFTTGTLEFCEDDISEIEFLPHDVGIFRMEIFISCFEEDNENVAVVHHQKERVETEVVLLPLYFSHDTGRDEPISQDKTGYLRLKWISKQKKCNGNTEHVSISQLSERKSRKDDKRHLLRIPSLQTIVMYTHTNSKYHQE
jgi:hypothetical protein